MMLLLHDDDECDKDNNNIVDIDSYDDKYYN